MREYSRIVIENYCAKSEFNPRFQRLAKIVARSYKIDSLYKSDEEANFIVDLIEQIRITNRIFVEKLVVLWRFLVQRNLFNLLLFLHTGLKRICIVGVLQIRLF